jgi:NAD(P)H dehydrogenase (quinone)
VPWCATRPRPPIWPPSGVEVVPGDLEDPASLDAATKGQDGIFLLLSFFSGTSAQADKLISAAKRSGVREIVWNATGPILPFDTGNPSIDFRRPVLAALQASAIPFVALQPTVYMENFLIPAISAEVAAQDTLAYPMPEAVNCQWISHQDAAAYVVAAFKCGPVDSQILEISGPERLNGPQIAERFGKALGRTIGFRPMPPAEFATAVAYGGNEGAIVSYCSAVFEQPEMMSTNVDHQAALDLPPITPMSVEDWARMYRAALTKA